jgi:hypothetical protein
MAKNIFITTEKDPKRFVLDNSTKEECWQLIRRLHHIIHCSVEYDGEGTVKFINDEDSMDMYRDQNPSFKVVSDRCDYLLGELDSFSSQYENRY